LKILIARSTATADLADIGSWYIEIHFYRWLATFILNSSIYSISWEYMFCTVD